MFRYIYVEQQMSNPLIQVIQEIHNQTNELQLSGTLSILSNHLNEVLIVLIANEKWKKSDLNNASD